jgi:hypothetical protein
MDVPTRYYFRGILQEDEGFIGQPYFEVNFNLYESDMFSATAIGGMWNSLHSEQTKITGGSRSRDAAHALGVSQRTLNPGFGQPESWYELDAYGGVALGLSDFELSTIWTTYLSPSGAFNEVNDIAFGLGYDDSDLLGDFALNPGVTIYLETEGAADGLDRGSMLQIHAGPEFGLTGGDNPITLSIPLEVGLSISDYYQDLSDIHNPATGDDDTFGYFLAGVDFGFPLTFIPCEYGNWLLNAGGRFITLGESLKEVNRKGDDYSFFGMFGLSMTY